MATGNAHDAQRLIDVDTDDVEALYEYAYAAGWTDGLPIIPPTEARVARMVAASGREPDAVIAELEPRRAPATVEKIAVNAVMAGCRPEYMPVLIAAVEALAQGPFNLHGVQTTTNPVAPLLILNGPVRQALDVNCGRNALGPGRRANATIGRAVRLLLLNVGGGIPGSGDMAILGMPAKYTFCLGENEEESPWRPLHVDLGYDPSDSVVTAFAACSLVNNLVDPAPHNLDAVLNVIANSMAQKGSNNFQMGGGNWLVVLPPGLAQLLHDNGYSKERTQEYLWERASLPEEAFPERERFPMGHPPISDGKIRPCHRAQDILLVVAGGPEPYHVMVMPNFGESVIASQRVRAGSG